MDIPKIKKEISLFINSEEAKVLKKDIAKLGLAASVIAGIMAQAQNSLAQHTDNTPHDSGDGPHASHTSHTDGPGHASKDGPHASCHNQANAHTSQPVYLSAEKRGGHSSHLDHSNTHCDSA